MAFCQELIDLDGEFRQFEMDNLVSSSGASTEEDDSEPLPGPSSAMNDFIWPTHRPHPLLIPDVSFL